MGLPITLTAAEEALLTDLPEGEVRDTLASHGLPNRRVEGWRWSDIRAALKAERGPSGPFAGAAAEPDDLTDLGGGEIVIENGRLVPGDLPSWVEVRAERAAPAVLPSAPLGSLATAAPVIRVRVVSQPDGPLVIRRRADGDGFHAVRLRIEQPGDVSLTVIEHWDTAGSPFVNGLTEWSVPANARAERIVLQPGTDEAVISDTALIDVAGGATFRQTVASTGAALSRHETRVTHRGGEASVTLDGLYRLDGKRHCDLTSDVRHQEPDGYTRQLVKGILSGRARGAFQGKFHVARPAQRTDAVMNHHALVLSDDATVGAKPELEIYADDVECAHGNTVGALDDEALFYLRQRGLPEGAARGLLIDAFAAEVMDRIADERSRNIVAGVFA